MVFPGKVRMSLGCDAIEKISDGEVQYQEGMRAELFEYCNTNLITIKIMQDLYKQAFQEANNSNGKYWIRVN